MQLFESLSKCFGNTEETRLKGGCGWEELGPIVNDVLHNLILVGIFIAVIMIMYAGYVLIQGQGSPDSRTRVRKIFTGIVIGVFLLVGSYYIVQFILDSFNVNDIYRKGVL